MSRSNPSDHIANPAARWFEWNGEHGTVRYHDKDSRANVDVPLPFTFLLLDELASVRGWHDASDSGIYSNEVKDTRTDVLVVKSFKGGLLAEGLYKDIKDRVNTLGGNFTANLYIAVQDDSEPSDPQWAIASLRFKGSSLAAWMEFRKACRSSLYNKAITIDGFDQGKKGRIVYRTPKFRTEDAGRVANEVATDLDRELQSFFEAYFSRKTNDRVQQPHASPDDDQPPTDDDEHSQPLTDDDIPFAWMLPFLLPAALLLHGVASWA